MHIRSPFAADASADGGPAYVTSVVLADGGASTPMVNLRNLALLNAFGDGSFADLTGPYANAARLAYDNTVGPCGTVDGQKYPQLYWACNNTSGLHIGNGSARWTYGAVNTRGHGGVRALTIRRPR